MPVNNAAMQRSKEVEIFALLRPGVKANGDIAHVESNLLFKQLVMFIGRSYDMESYFQYELTPNVMPTERSDDLSYQRCCSKMTF